MPIAAVLVLLWVGTFLDMVSTYYMAVLHAGKFKEVNQNFTPGEADFIVINAIFLFVFSVGALFALIDLMATKKYLQATNFITYLKEITSKKYFRRKDFVSLKTVSLVSLLVTVGSIGGARFLAFANNLLEYFGYAGLIRLFLETFSLNEQLAVYIVFAITALAFFPLTYWLLRLAAR